MVWHMEGQGAAVLTSACHGHASSRSSASWQASGAVKPIGRQCHRAIRLQGIKVEDSDEPAPAPAPAPAHSSDEDIDAEAEVLEQQGEVLEQSNSWPGKVLERFNSSRMAVLAQVF